MYYFSSTSQLDATLYWSITQNLNKIHGCNVTKSEAVKVFASSCTAAVNVRKKLKIRNDWVTDSALFFSFLFINNHSPVTEPWSPIDLEHDPFSFASRAACLANNLQEGQQLLYLTTLLYHTTPFRVCVALQPSIQTRRWGISPKSNHRLWSWWHVFIMLLSLEELYVFVTSIIQRKGI